MNIDGPMVELSTEEITVSGLSEPVEILVDRWGVSHVYAQSQDDVFVAQGFNAARDRLWQIDFWRRRGLGILAEVLGSRYADRDRAARLFLFRGDMECEWASYDSSTKRTVEAFVQGVNAFVKLTREDRSRLPEEFKQLGYEPAIWSTEDVVRIRSSMTYYNVREEVTRALTIRDHGTATEDLRRQREPARTLRIPTGLDLNRIPDDVLNVYDLGVNPPSLPLITAEPRKESPEGSNNWVLAGDRTSSGRPLLANDPHRVADSLPGLRYIVHLNAPGLDVIGGGEPSLPGISIGHNGTAAFGLTTFPVDQEDLYVYEVNPDHPRQYMYRGAWTEMDVVSEVINVKGGQPIEANLLFTRHGPVIYQDSDGDTAFGLRAAWLEPGMAPYLASLGYLTSKNYEGFFEALDLWGSPPLNQVYADVNGDIAWKAVGLAPIRPNWDGTLPVPGDGSYEWDGFFAPGDLPSLVNPEEGWIATANEMNLPCDFRSEAPITYDWMAPSRRERLEQVLSCSFDATVPDMVVLQADFLSVPARRILSVVREFDFTSVEVRPELDMLLTWDGVLSADSSAATLYEVWYRRHFRPRLFAEVLQRTVRDEGDIDRALERVSNRGDSIVDARVELGLLADHRALLGPESGAILAELVDVTLTAAAAELTSMLGPDRSLWAWGRLHKATAKHPIASLLTGLDESLLSVGPVARGGNGETVCLTAYGENFSQTVGSTFRLVVDVGNWDGSVAMNAPGQSGDLWSRHHSDLFEPWAAGKAFPLVYSRAYVEAATEHVVILRPRER